MIVQCAACQTRFKIADEKVTDRGVKVRCTKCSNTFVVRKDGPAPPPDAPPVAAAARPARVADPFAGLGKAPSPSGDPFAALGPGKPAPSLEQATNPGMFLGDLGDFSADDESAFKEVTRVGVSIAHIQASRRDAPIPPITTPKMTPAVAASAAPDPFAAFSLDASPPAPPPPEQDPFAGAGLDVASSALQSAAEPPPPAARDPFASLGDPFASLPAAPADPFGGAAADPFAATAEASGSDPFAAGLPSPGADPFGAGAFDFSGGLDLGATDSAGADPFSAVAAEGSGAPGLAARPDFDFSAAAGPGLELDRSSTAAPAQGQLPEISVPIARLPTPKPEVRKPNEATREPDVTAAPRPAAKRRAPSARSTASALLNALVYALIGLGMLATLFVVQNDGQLSLSELSLETALETLAGKGAGDFPVRSVSNGLYETRSGRPVFYVRGEVENLTDTARHLGVRVELVSGSNIARRSDGVAGALPSPEELFELTDATAFATLQARLARRGLPVEAGGSREFLVVFYEFPDNLPDLRLRITAEPIEALAAADTPDVPSEQAEAAGSKPVETTAAVADEPPSSPSPGEAAPPRKKSRKPVPPLPDLSKEPPRKLLINSGKPGSAGANR